MRRTALMPLGLLASGVLVGGLATAETPMDPTQKGKSAASTKAAATTPVRYLPNRLAGRAGAYYRGLWGIDSVTVKWAESGELVRFSYRVLDPTKAGLLNDKNAQPSLIDPQAGVSLVVPTMEKVGQLRQSATPESGKSYWMAFSNQGRRVRRGDRVSVVIGQFHADWLVVE